MVAQAGEFVVLSNGFRMHADSHTVDGPVIRLKTDQGEIEIQANTVASFEAEFVKCMREAAPAIATSFLFDHPVALPSPSQPTPLFPPVDAIGPKHDLVSPALLSQASAAGLTVHPWTVDDAARIARLTAMGVDGIITNDPRLFAPS